MPDIINDATVQFGSVIIAITNNGGTSQNFVCENVSLTRPTNEINRLGETGLPSGAVHTRGFITGTASVQIATGSIVWPEIGAVFTEDFGHGSEDWYLTEVGDALAHTDAKKVSISFKKKVGTVVVS